MYGIYKLMYCEELNVYRLMSGHRICAITPDRIPDEGQCAAYFRMAKDHPGQWVEWWEGKKLPPNEQQGKLFKD